MHYSIQTRSHIYSIWMKESNKEKSDATESVRGKNKGDSLAKRIEDEIKSARAFAEKKYYSGDNEEVFWTHSGGYRGHAAH